MSRLVACIVLLGFASIVNALDNFTISLSPAPFPGQPFNITWSADTLGDVSVILNTYASSSNPVNDNVFSSQVLAVISNSGSYLWQVPSGLCGTFSFTIGVGTTTRYSLSQIWSITCPSTSSSITPTTACSSSIPSPTGANPFLIPNAGDYPIRVGKVNNISWKPTTSGTVSIRTHSSVSNTTTIIADKIANSGTFAWIPSSNLSSSSDSSTAGAEYVLQIVDDASQKVTSTSPNIYLLSLSYYSVFIDVYEWMDPVIGGSVTISWSPSNATTISIEVAPGTQPDFEQSIQIATNVPNNGSFVWNVAANFTHGQYTVVAFTPGNLFDDLQTIFISSTTPSPCSPSANGATPSSTTQALGTGAGTGAGTTSSTPSSGVGSGINCNSLIAAISTLLFHIFYLV